MSERFQRRELWLLAAWLVLLVLWMARGTLALPYLSDDYEHVQLISQIRAGIEPGRDLFTTPFHGQWTVLLRMLFWFGTMAGGMSLVWVRLGIWIVHAAGAIGCAILCMRWTGSRLAGWLGGTLYAGAVGFIGEELWWPSSGIFCLGVAFFILALLALETRRLWLCGLLLAVAALGLNGILAAALGLPICYWLLRRSRPPAWILIAAVAFLVAGFWRVGVSLRGLGLGAWLVYSAPLRFLTSWTTLPIPGFRTIVYLSPIVWALAIASLWFLSATERRVLLAVWTPAILLALLIGMARSDYPFRYGPGWLYSADRYYYVFLFPLVVECVLFLVKARWLALIALIALLGSRAHYVANVPRANFALSSHALEQGRELVQAIRSLPSRPLLLADKPILIDGAHKNSMTLAFLVYSQYPRGIAGVRVVHGPLEPRQQAIEEALLKPWRRPTPSVIDFKDHSYEEDLDSGFSWWEPPFRWMSKRGELHLLAAPGDLVLRAYAPVEQLHRSIQLAIAVNGRLVGELAISEPGVRDYRLSVAELPAGSAVNITVTSDFAWHPRDIFPDSLDDRELSVALSSIGFAVRP